MSVHTRHPDNPTSPVFVLSVVVIMEALLLQREQLGCP
jgi:hypothetical protein